MPRDRTAAYDALARRLAEQLVTAGHATVEWTGEVDPARYDADQRRHADRVSASLLPAFRHAGDTELRTGAETRPTLLRVHVADDGWAHAESGVLAAEGGGAGGALLRAIGRRPTVRTVLLVTELDDGSIVATRTGPPLVLDAPPGQDWLVVGRRADVAEVVTQHRERVSRHLGARPGAVVVPVRDLGDAYRLGLRILAAQSDFRASVGYVTDGELRRWLGRHHDEIAGRVRAHLDDLVSATG